jgi:enamine deaminase RidA (YjgF/YER057c/UK114 family)
MTPRTPANQEGPDRARPPARSPNTRRHACNLIGRSNLALQSRKLFSNVGPALAAAGARPEQVTKITIFVVDYRREHLPAIGAGGGALFGDHKPADTVVGVEALSHPDYLIEVEAIAVLPDRDIAPRRERFFAIGEG